MGSINVKYVITPIELQKPWKKVFVSKLFEQKIPITIYENPYFKPRWYFADQVIFTQENNYDKSYELMRNNQNFDTITIIESNNNINWNTQSSESDQLNLILYTAGDLKIKSNTTNYRWLIFSEAKAPFWQAKINGQNTILYQANHAFQAVLVPPGKNEVEFYYPTFWQQTVISYKFFIDKLFK